MTTPLHSVSFTASGPRRDKNASGLREKEGGMDLSSICWKCFLSSEEKTKIPHMSNFFHPSMTRKLIGGSFPELIAL